ncbi:MAG: DUF952 domain-containing protein [Bdellovibrionales bacterium]|nr:DUF952 domain-containing protein [Bdellovibrionales bacterium]
MANIYHITTLEDWSLAKKTGHYLSSSLKNEGFIHCSTATQYLRIANSLFSGRKDTLLLEIDEDKVNAEIRYENLEGGSEHFPHIYGPLNLDSVLRVIDFPSDENGQYSSPI